MLQQRQAASRKGSKRAHAVGFKERGRTCVSVVASLMAKGTLTRRASVLASSVLPQPVGPCTSDGTDTRQGHTGWGVSAARLAGGAAHVHPSLHTLRLRLSMF